MTTEKLVSTSIFLIFVISILFIKNGFEAMRMDLMFKGVEKDVARDRTMLFSIVSCLVAYVVNERMNEQERRRRNGRTSTEASTGGGISNENAMKIFMTRQALKTWFMYRKVYATMPWVIYRKQKQALTQELEREMRSFEAKAFDGKNMGIWSTQKHKNARRTLKIWRKSREVMNGYEDNLQKLRKLCENIEIPECVMIDGDRENCLRRSLSATKNSSDVKQAHKNLQKTVLFGDEVNPRELLRQFGKYNEEEKSLRMEHPRMTVYTTHTPLGIPVLVMRVADSNKAMINSTNSLSRSRQITKQNFAMTLCYLANIVFPSLKKKDSVIVDDKCVMVFDLSKSKHPLPTKNKRKALESVVDNLTLFRQMYPDFVYKIYLVNASRNARLIYAAVSAFLPAQIRKKITLLGRFKEDASAVDEIADVFGGLERTPTFFGGTCERSIDECGPWGVKDLSDNKFRGWEREDISMVEREKKPIIVSPFKVGRSVISSASKKISKLAEKQPEDLSAVAFDRRTSYIREHTI